MIERLRLLLKLPEYGDVRVALTVNRRGAVIDLDVLESQSEANATYVRAELAGVQLAGFGKSFAGEENHTFAITLTNA